jgi:aldose 1-epimerase
LKAFFGQADGQPVEIYTITNSHGLEARLMTYGATLVSLKTPDRSGKLADIVLGFDSLAPYLSGTSYLGATVGRYANRIANARFTVGGDAHQLAANDGPNNLHGGTKGFDKRVWKVESADNGAVRMRYVSADGEEGFPGQVAAQATYRLGEDDSLSITYEATTTAPTPVNLANHAYFNLTGDRTRDVLGHEVMIAASAFTPVDATLIPTGEIRPVAGTPFDFRTARTIGARIAIPDEQLGRGHGYDHNWVLDKSAPGALSLAAIVIDPQSGRRLEVRTTQPGVQVYSGNYLSGAPFARRTGLCLETQHFPDSPNRPSFPDTILKPGETYRETTIFFFGTAK